MKTQGFGVVLLVVILINHVAPATAVEPRSMLVLQSGVVVVPQNTDFTLQLNSPISTHGNKKGDRFSCTVLEPPEFADAIVSGRVGKIKSSKRAGGRAEFTLYFDKITLQDGRTGGFDADVKQVIGEARVKHMEQTESGRVAMQTTAKLQVDPEGRIKAPSLFLRNAGVVAGTTAAGAAAGAAAGGGVGAAEGAAAGLTAGVLIALLSKGPDVILDAGTKVVVLSAGRTEGRGKGKRK